MDVYWDEGWLGRDNLDLREIVSRGYDVTVLYQTERHAKFLNDSGRRVVFVPMYDSCLPFSESFWRELTNIEILCFCRTLFEQLQAWGLHAKYAQFFPDPAHFEVNIEQQYAGFFWQRREDPSWNTLRLLVRDASLSWINIHQAPDLDSTTTTAISKSDQEQYRLRFSIWSEDRGIYDRALNQAGIYFAPRLHEGIGMSFLEAMAMGKAVVAADNPTMNEYLTHNVNGYLFNPEDPQPISLDHFRTMGRMARQTIERGYPGWQQSREQIATWLVTGLWPKRRPLVTQCKDDSSKISVISLLSTDCNDLEKVHLNVTTQAYPNLEHIIVGNSQPALKAETSYKHVSVPKAAGRSEMMNIAASMARGEWIIFLNPGDSLFDENVLREALEGHSLCTDFIVGHYLEIRGKCESTHRVADFESTCERLSAQKLDPLWIARLPTLSATLINRRVTQEHRFSTQFHLAAGIDLIFRRKRAGACIRHANTTIARIRGDSFDQRLRRLTEYREIFSRETANPRIVRSLCASLREAECETRLRSWTHLGPSHLCANLMRNPAVARYAIARSWERLCFLGIRGILLRQFLWFRNRSRSVRQPSHPRKRAKLKLRL